MDFLDQGYTMITYGNNEIIPTDRECRFSNLADMFNVLYKNLFSLRIDLLETRVVFYYRDVPVTFFKLAFNKGLVLYNDDNYIRPYSISPPHTGIDFAYCKMVEANQNSVISNNQHLSKLHNLLCTPATTCVVDKITQKIPSTVLMSTVVTDKKENMSVLAKNIDHPPKQIKHRAIIERAKNVPTNIISPKNSCEQPSKEIVK